MELQDGILHIQSFLAVTIGIVVLFVGKRLNEQVGFLREFSIPEPVTGGLLFSLLFGLLYAASGIAVQFELQARDVLLVYFFTTIGINASARDLLAGGRPLLILLVVTIAFMFAQNLMGLGVASLFGLPPAVGILGGSVSLIGGHGTTIAWAPYFIKSQGIANANEIGIACATLGLILASLMGGPIANLLINRYQLAPPPEAVQEVRDIGFTEAQRKAGIGHLDFLDAVLAIHICIIVGYLLNGIIEDLGLRLPLFVTCLFAGILITNLVPKQFPTITGTHWPARTPSMALIADIALGSFLAMSLMSMQLWTLIDLAGPILAILTAQLALAVFVVWFVLFPLMGKSYDAAVMVAGFIGVSLGATPVAMANMAAVTQRFGASHRAFIILPLVSAFFIDLANAMLIPFFLRHF
jgi:glutamate:Na+ symporter, ESS family